MKTPCSLFLALFFVATTLHAQSPSQNWYLQRGFSRGVFPHVGSFNGERDLNREKRLGTDLENFSNSVEDTFVSIIQKRNARCLGHDCLFQGIPIAYSRPGSGFWGGARLKVTDISRRNPDLWSMDLFAVRSDSKQWVGRGGFDFPQINSLPLNPRIKIRGHYSRSTEARYYGQGEISKTYAEKRSDEAARYDLRSVGYELFLGIPVYKNAPLDVSLFSQYVYKKQNNRPVNANDSILFEAQPLGIGAPHSASVHAGVIVETIRREKLPTKGWSDSLSFAVAVPKYAKRYSYRRLTFIDKRYLNIAHRVVFAHRFTYDRLFDPAPYWEQSAVGGPDPIPNIASSDLLRVYQSGRFHEDSKILSSSEIRWHLQPIKLWGQYCEPAVVPFGINFGYFSGLKALSGFAGSHLLCSNSFLMQAMVGYSKMGPALEVEFGQNF